MTDRKQLESIAKVMRYTLEDHLDNLPWCPELERNWNPIISNDDCAAMCAQLEIDTVWHSGVSVVCSWNGAHNTREFYVDYDNDRLAAWRASACNVAAELGELK